MRGVRNEANPLDPETLREFDPETLEHDEAIRGPSDAYEQALELAGVKFDNVEVAA